MIAETDILAEAKLFGEGRPPTVTVAPLGPVRLNKENSPGELTTKPHRSEKVLLVEHLYAQKVKAVEKNLETAYKRIGRAQQAFNCPILNEPFVDPVMAADGHT